MSSANTLGNITVDPVSGAREVFALTDEQILGMEAEGQGVAEDPSSAVATTSGSTRDDWKSAQPGMAVPQELGQEPPGWLAREMKDPWVGEEARELWEGVHRAHREAAAYRETFATPEDARALKEIYPGGVAEAKTAAARAREMAEIDAVFFGAAGKPAEELRAGRAALVEKLYAQDPAAFREMVEAGVRLLEGAGKGEKVTSGEWRVTSEKNRSLDSGLQIAQTSARDDKQGNEHGAESSTDSGARADGKSAQAGVPVPQEVVSRYREFERATNAELEKSVGGAIGRAMEAALPNLRHANGAGREEPFGQTQGKQAPPLQERLRAAVTEEVETALRSDASLGEQVARVLSGRRFDEAARAQVVRLIDARAQQLVPGAVRRVVGAWTQATLGARNTNAVPEPVARGDQERRVDRPANTSQRTASGDSVESRNAQSAGRSFPRGRVDYRKLSDEQILGM